MTSGRCAHVRHTGADSEAQHLSYELDPHRRGASAHGQPPHSPSYPEQSLGPPAEKAALVCIQAPLQAPALLRRHKRSVLQLLQPSPAQNQALGYPKAAANSARARGAHVGGVASHAIGQYLCIHLQRHVRRPHPVPQGVFL